MKYFNLLTLAIIFSCACFSSCQQHEEGNQAVQMQLIAKLDTSSNTIEIFRLGETTPILTQHALPDFRPYLHPIEAPDGQGPLTEYSPGHHKHQTGLYWGFTRVNGRDYFHHPEGDYWRKVSASVLEAEGVEVRWQTVYELLDENGEVIMEESQKWRMQDQGEQFIMDLEWSGKAMQKVEVGEYDYGGLFLRMPWYKGIAGEVMNAARQKNEQAEGQRAMWIDVGMQLEGRDDFAHIAIFDHPENKGFPQTWRVDGQLGVGPVRARMGSWNIVQGETETIKHRLIAYTGTLNDVELTNQWNEYIGSNSIYTTASLWGIAQEEGRQAKFLEADEAVAEMTIQEGFEVNAYASEPMITQPMAFCWDDKGRLWIAENRDYESRGDGFSNFGNSRILILEDTDRDGVADKRTVFLEGIPFPSAIAVGFGGLYLGAPPHMMFVPDKDGDDKADMEDIEILLTGWGIRDRHETINSFHWGPDGWLYGLEGFATPSRIRKPGPNEKMYAHNDPFPDDIFEKEGVDINGGVWRFHPVKKEFEVVAHGFSNPWGIDYDAKGNFFISACVIPHMFHVINGGIYQRQGGKHFNPYFYSDIQTIVNHRHRSAHGGARIYQSDAFPSEHQGRLFMANIHEHAVLSDVLEAKGSGFVAHHGDDFLLANNAQWIGFSMEVGPDGGLYVLDWHDADICGKEVLHKETGRVFRIMPKKSNAKGFEGRYGDLSEMNDLQLAKLQESPSDWHARRARTILQYRATSSAIDGEAIAYLNKIYQTGQEPLSLKALWSLWMINALSEELLLEALEDKNEYVRAWAIQYLTEDKNPSKTSLKKLEQLATSDQSAVVRLHLAAALQRIPLKDRWQIASSLSDRAEDLDDHNIPLMIWFGIEALSKEDPARFIDIAKSAQIPLLPEYIARRMVDGEEIESLLAAIDQRGFRKNKGHLLKGMLTALEGLQDVEAPDNWASVYDKLKEDRAYKEMALAIAQRFGDAEAARQYMADLKDQANATEDRLIALEKLSKEQWNELIPEIPSLLQEDEMRLGAIKAIASFDDEKLGALLMGEYDSFSKEEKQEVVHTMASRSRYGNMLTRELKQGTIPKKDIPAYVARQLRRVVGNGFVEYWGPIDQMEGQKSIAYEKYTRLISDGSNRKFDLNNGRRLYQSSCGACHKMYGEGGEIGPDITGSNRTNLDYLLGNILYPSEEIQDDYKMEIISTRDGRTYIGNVAAEDGRSITLKVVGTEAVVIPISSIQSRETSESSLMPEGLLENLSEQEVLDLIGYLRYYNGETL